MSKLLLFLTVLFTGMAVADDQKAVDMFMAARIRTDLRNNNPEPYSISGTITLPEAGGGNLKGQYKSVWLPEGWFSTIELPTGVRTIGGSQGTLWTKRPVRSFRLAQIEAAVESLRLEFPTRGKIGKLKRQKQLSCSDVQEDDYTTTKVCFDASGLPAEIHTRLWIYRYSDWAALGAKSIPQQIHILEDKAIVAELRFKVDPSPAANQFLFRPPAGAQTIPACASIPLPFEVLPSRRIDSVRPRYPQSAKLERRQGDVYIFAVVGPDGSVRHVEIIRKAFADLDEASVAAARQFLYKPVEACGIPVEAETIIKVSFTLSG